VKVPQRALPSCDRAEHNPKRPNSAERPESLPDQSSDTADAVVCGVYCVYVCRFTFHCLQNSLQNVNWFHVICVSFGVHNEALITNILLRGVETDVTLGEVTVLKIRDNPRFRKFS
jgi:hypothetical protein